MLSQKGNATTLSAVLKLGFDVGEAAIGCVETGDSIRKPSNHSSRFAVRLLRISRIWPHDCHPAPYLPRRRFLRPSEEEEVSELEEHDLLAQRIRCLERELEKFRQQTASEGRG
jgi:hypothetical protein